MLLLDTTVVIDVLRGRPAAARLDLLRRTEPSPLVCAITVEEVWRGALSHEEESTRHLLEGLRVAPLAGREGELAGRWGREFAARGVTLSQADCLIAAAAVSAGARLATGNPSDFPMPGLELEHWPTGA